jgi:hypothetical protein
VKKREDRLKQFSMVAISFISLLVLGCHTSRPTNSFKAPATVKSEILIGAGDIADCRDLTGAEATAKLLEQNPGTVMAVGDLAYPDGTKENFQCYDRTWGRVKARTRPSPGNHEFHSGGATPYFDYFGSAAGTAAEGYYSYELGAWHIVVLNGECKDVGGCQSGSPQEKWLRADLAAHPAACTLAYWHKPLFSSGGAHGNDLEVLPLWQALYERKADVVVNGHDHNYERFAPQNPQGEPDADHGIREFVVGTGGKNLRPMGSTKANSEVRNNEAFGVLKLTLSPTGYEWLFIPQEGKTFTDSGTAQCHH